MGPWRACPPVLDGLEAEQAAEEGAQEGPEDAEQRDAIVNVAVRPNKYVANALDRRRRLKADRIDGIDSRVELVAGSQGQAMFAIGPARTVASEHLFG